MLLLATRTQNHVSHSQHQHVEQVLHPLARALHTLGQTPSLVYWATKRQNPTRSAGAESSQMCTENCPNIRGWLNPNADFGGFSANIRKVRQAAYRQQTDVATAANGGFSMRRNSARGRSREMEGRVCKGRYLRLADVCTDRSIALVS